MLNTFFKKMEDEKPDAFGSPSAHAVPIEYHAVPLPLSERAMPLL
jgi:hypothetical protein